MTKRVTSWWGPFLRHCARATQLLRRNVAAVASSIGNTESDLTGPRFEYQTSRSRDEGVTARPTGRSTSNA